MKLSQLFTKTSKESHSDASSVNADLLTRAGYIHKSMAGVYSFLPLGLKVLRSIEQIVREEMNRIGGQEVLLSAFGPKENWETTGRWDHKVLDVLFHVPAAGDQEYALNPTHEEMITPLVQTYIHSYRDLPFAAYQIQTKFRNELRAKSGILRGREFLMKDLYSFHMDQADLERYYAVVQTAYDEVFARLGLAEKTYLTYASGGSFSKYSHEYQVVLPQGEDVIYVSEEAEAKGQRIAINKEIYVAGETVCPVTGGRNFREEKASEAGNIFMLGNRFSSAFKLQANDAEGKLQDIIMGCYGIGISRLMGIIAEAMSDASGLCWPAQIAPAQVHIVAIAKKPDDASFVAAEKLYTLLTQQGIACLFDDRIDQSVGSRLADADLIGVPYRAVISPKSMEKEGIELKIRKTGEVRMITQEELLKMILS